MALLAAAAAIAGCSNSSALGGQGGSAGGSGGAGGLRGSAGGSGEPRAGRGGDASAGAAGSAGLGVGGRAGPRRSVMFYGSTTEVAPYLIANGPDGNLWTTDRNIQNYLSSFTPSGFSHMFGIGSSPAHELTGLVTGPDHALWIANTTGWIHRFDPARPGSQMAYAINGGTPAYIAVGPDGALWFTDPRRNVIGRITTAGSTSSFPIPTPASGAQGIVAGPDGNLWFTESDANQIGRLTPAGALMEFAVPTVKSAPQQIAVGPDGALWFTERDANQLGRITTSGAISELGLPTPGSKPVGIAAGPDSAVWFTETAGGAVGRMTMTGTVTEFPVDGSGTQPFAITVGPDGNLWYTLGAGIGGVVRLTPESKPFCLLYYPGTTYVSCGGATQTSTIMNGGQTPSGPITVTLDDTNPLASAFRLGGTCAGGSLNPGESCTITASFAQPPGERSDSYAVIMKVQPQLGDLYEMFLVVSDCQ